MENWKKKEIKLKKKKKKENRALFRNRWTLNVIKLKFNYAEPTKQTVNWNKKQTQNK